jgi:hypothetical protein
MFQSKLSCSSLPSSTATATAVAPASVAHLNVASSQGQQQQQLQQRESDDELASALTFLSKVSYHCANILL